MHWKATKNNQPPTTTNDELLALIARAELSCSRPVQNATRTGPQWTQHYNCELVLLAAIGGVLGESEFQCRQYRRYAQLNTCFVENVDLDAVPDLGELSFPPEVDVEFRDARFRFLGVELFQLMGDTERLTLRGGFTREIIFWSESVEVLRVINTDLVIFDVLGEPNYSLKQLAIRSELFSRWSVSMSYLKSLEVIDVAYCNFTRFNLSQLAGFQNLTVVDLSYNKLQALDSGPILKLKNLKELHLAGNQLQFVWRFPNVVPNLDFVTLSDNPWMCEWVKMARKAIWMNKITLMDSDYDCEVGRENVSGLCCKRSNVENTTDIRIQKGIIDILVEEIDNGTKAVGAEMGGAAVYLDDPIAV